MSDYTIERLWLWIAALRRERHSLADALEPYARAWAEERRECIRSNEAPKWEVIP